MLGTKEDFELIRQQINIEAVANHLMKKQGKNYIFPSEKSASVRIYPETQSFYDFGRCTGGDVIRLSAKAEEINAKRIEDAKHAAGITEETNTFASL